jgi:hypothetical protein
MVSQTMLARIGNAIIHFAKAKDELELIAKESKKDSIQTLMAKLVKEVEDISFKLDITADEIRNEI